MKKYIYLLFIATICLGGSASAVPGDTTWVQANIAQLSWYGNYDTTIFFPHLSTDTVTYRRIYMIFTLGKYTCPAGSSWCGDWDYTVQNYLITPGGETFELGRLITPYANASAPRTPWTWKQYYVFDVTDFAPVLHDSGKMRILYSGYSGGFTANIKFAFIEGIPDRKVLAVKRLYTGSYTYGDTTHHDSNNINVHFPPMLDTAPVGTHFSEMKVAVTGHGSDGNYCNEFCSHNYYVYLNGGVVDSYTIWRNKCGVNELYPQSGTWLYDRANWCPGELVHTVVHKLPGISSGTYSVLGMKFDPYIITGSGTPSYTTETNLFYYGNYNKTIDVSLDQIISPNSDNNFFRENPTCGLPTIHVKNTGATTIDSITFQYRLKDSTPNYFTWVGTLHSLEETEIYLDRLPELYSLAGASGNFYFVANIYKVNGVVDADQTNDTLTSTFVAAPRWTNTFHINFKTNNETLPGSSTLCETSWFIYDWNNNVIAKRDSVAISTLFRDTLVLIPGCYRLEIKDAGCDGLNWWAFSGTGITGGLLQVTNNVGTPVAMHGYHYAGSSYDNDFGCNYTEYFTIRWTLGLENISENSTAMTAFPNPAQNTLFVNFSGYQQVSGTIFVLDALGRTVMETGCSGNEKQLDVSALQNGIYTILFIDEANKENRLTTRVVIVK